MQRLICTCIDGKMGATPQPIRYERWLVVTCRIHLYLFLELTAMATPGIQHSKLLLDGCSPQQPLITNTRNLGTMIACTFLHCLQNGQDQPFGAEMVSVP